MKKLAATFVLLALVGTVLGFASSAQAFPTKTAACSQSQCHGRSTAVKITITKISQTSRTAKYSIKVTGGRGVAGWAVKYGARNLARRTASTGTFTVARGKTYKVWAVKLSSGANYKTLIVK